MFDYVVVGSGSAGSVIANRLTESGKYSVCLLEAGGSDQHPLISMPMTCFRAMTDMRFSWLFETNPQQQLDGRRIFCPRGKVLGGSSSINGTFYVRGHSDDYDEWAKENGEGWSYRSVLPYFKRSEHQERGGDEYHGTGGPLNVSDSPRLMPFTHRVIEAATQLGYPLTDDFNGTEQEGFGYFQYTIKNGRRCSAADAFLHPITHRSNLTIITKARANRIEWEGKVAKGVAYTRRGKVEKAMARREVIICSGAIGSPQLLLLSGIGPADELKEHGIPVVHDLKGVGKNLQEHADIGILRSTKAPGTLSFTAKDVLNWAPSVIKYFYSWRGLPQMFPSDTGGFVKSDPKLKKPDLQISFAPARSRNHGRDMETFRKSGYAAHATLLRPKSRGEVTLNDSSPASDPRIDLRLLEHPDDVETLVKGIRFLKNLLDSPVFDDCKQTSDDQLLEDPTDEQLTEFLRQEVQHIYHPVGTCKMGTDKMSVVDAGLKVHGVKSLRVIDASVMPTIVGGNTNAPTIMIGERGADLILDSVEANTEEPVPPPVLTATKAKKPVKSRQGARQKVPSR